MGVWGLEMLWVLLGILIMTWAIRMLEWSWWKPRRLERALRAQGLKGTPYRFLYGDLKQNARLIKEARSKPIIPHSHSIISRVAPLLFHSMNEHGKISFTWLGPTPRVTITDPELIREILSNKFGHFQKQIGSRAMPVPGLVSFEGEKWAKHRRIINPAFHVEKLKRMHPAFSTCCSELISRWENLVSSQGLCELDVWPELQNFTADVISRTAFGSNYEEGRRIFQLQGERAEILFRTANSLYIPVYRFLPTSRSLRVKEIDREIGEILRGLIKKRENEIKGGAVNTQDLLGMLLESNLAEEGKSTNLILTTEEVIAECQLFYFAGQETTSVLLTWTMIALTMHPSWQFRAREEVLKVFGKSIPDIEGLSHLKIVPMILNEVLRLYPPAFQLHPRTCKTMKLGGITYPEGVTLSIPVIFIHHDPEFWGEDAHEFNPARFAGGVSKASKDQVAFFPFGWGPRICIGQHFAMMEAKMGLSMILQHFEFELSPSYSHAPFPVITVHPQYGAQIILHKL